MAQLLEEYRTAIDNAKDYESLDKAVDYCISNNVISAVIPDIKSVIDRLNLDSPYDSFIHTLAWSTTTSTHSESILELLKYFCNKIAASFDSLVYPMNNFSLGIFCICIDDKEIIKSFTREQQFSLVYTLSGINLDSMIDNYIQDGLDGYDSKDSLRRSIAEHLLASIEYALEFKTLDGVMQAMNRDFYQTTSKMYMRYIQPFMKQFLNMIYNTDQLGLIHDMVLQDWSDYIYKMLDAYSTRYHDRFKGGSMYDYKFCTWNLIVEVKECLNELSTTGYTTVPNPPMGRFTLWYSRAIEELYNECKVSQEQCIFIMRDMLSICQKYFSYNEDHMRMIESFITKLCTYGTEAVFVEEEMYKSLAMYLEKNDDFKMWLELVREDLNEIPIKNIYGMYFNSVVSGDKTSDSVIIDTDPATEAKSTQWKYEEDEEDEEKDKEDEEGEEDSEEDDQTDEEYDGPEIEAKQSNKGYKKHSKSQAEASKKIYKAYKTYKDNESKVDSQLSKMITSMKNAFTQDKTEEIIEGKRFSPIGILKKALLTSAIFSYSKVAGIIYLVTSHTLGKKRTARQKQDIIMQMNSEIEMLDEKIEDARGDGNRKAKYALMRTRTELVRARDKIKYNLNATKEDMATAKRMIQKRNKDNEL